ncbi:hypothetical protein MP228_009588 [Amoeboaphelidium protococcarum]|nr:hypothetical protein MP228_009588 [Amoeboaphelidium protococcarum]
MQRIFMLNINISFKDEVGVTATLSRLSREERSIVQHLWLQGSKLRQIPEVVFTLINLKTLDLGDNLIDNVPDKISLLQQLTLLDLSCNSLSRLPREIAKLTRLDTLYLSGNIMHPDLCLNFYKDRAGVQQLLRFFASNPIVPRAKLISKRSCEDMSDSNLAIDACHGPLQSRKQLVKLTLHHQDDDDSLINAVRQGSVPLCLQILERSSHLVKSKCQKSGLYPLHIAVMKDKPKILNALVQCNLAEVNALSAHQDTALHLAAMHNRLTCLEILLRHNADIEALDMYGNTPLLVAASRGHLKICDALIAAGANTGIINQCGMNVESILHESVGQDAAQKCLNRWREISQQRVIDQCCADILLQQFGVKELVFQSGELDFNHNISGLVNSVRQAWLSEQQSSEIFQICQHLGRKQAGALEILLNALAIGSLVRYKLTTSDEMRAELYKYFERGQTSGSLNPLCLIATARLLYLERGDAIRVEYFTLVCKFKTMVNDQLCQCWLTSYESELLKETFESMRHSVVLEQISNFKEDDQQKQNLTVDQQLLEEWTAIAEELNLTDVQRKPMNELMDLVGLLEVKRLAMNLYKDCIQNARLLEQGYSEAVFPMSLNFMFVGNPGTGKTVVAQVFAQILHQSGVRRNDKFVKMTAGEALRKGVKAFAAILASLTGGSLASPPCNLNDVYRKNLQVEVLSNVDGLWYAGNILNADANSKLYSVKYTDDTVEDNILHQRIRPLSQKAHLGGVLFIDEAYDLNPSSDTVGRVILSEIMSAAEEHYNKLTIILAGYKDDIEQNLCDFNIGMFSRFQWVSFNDFTEPQLGQIWSGMVDKAGIGIEGSKDQFTAVVQRRLGRGIGCKGFSNARSVRQLFHRAVMSAKSKYRDGRLTMCIEDVIGARPLPENIPELASALNRLDFLIGIEDVKQQIRSILKTAQENYDRELRLEPTDSICLNRIFWGPPGTGKTTVAEIYGQVLASLNLLSKGDVVKKTASDFIGQYIGQTQTKTNSIIKLAQGRVLLIDEAYALLGSSANEKSFGQDCINTLVEKVQGYPGEDIAVVLMGYKSEMQQMLRNSNSGLGRRFNKQMAFEFKDFTNEQLFRIFTNVCTQRQLSASVSVRVHAVQILEKMKLLTNFGNAGSVNSLISEAVQRMIARGESSRKLIETDLKNEEVATLADGLQSISSYPELYGEMMNLQKIISRRKQEGRNLQDLVGHFVFTGSPGTGKTTVARQLSVILHSFGLIASPKLVETSAYDLVAKYVGHTSANVTEKLKEAKGGLLFIDEAYDLGQSQFGKDAVATLISSLTKPEYMNGKTAVVLAGYTKQMHQMFELNPGLKGRFNKFIQFSDWNAERCVEFVKDQLAQLKPAGLCLEPSAQTLLFEGFAALQNRPGWCNGRDAVEVVRKMLFYRDLRLSDAVDDSMSSIVNVDIKLAFDEMLMGRPMVGATVEVADDRLQFGEAAVQIRADVRQSAAPGLNSRPWNQDLDSITKNCAAVARQLGLDECNSMSPAIDQSQLIDPPEQSEWECNTDRAAAQKDKDDLESCRFTVENAQKLVADAVQQNMSTEELSRLKRELQIAEKVLSELEEKLLKEQKLRKALRRIGKCEMGYEWRREGSGYRCAGGSHYVHDNQLNEI